MRLSNKITTVTMIQILKIKKKPFSKTLTQSLKTDLKEIDNLSASLEKLSVSHREPKLPKPPTLKKNIKVQFQFKDSNEWRTAVLISRSGKLLANIAKNGIANLMMIASIP